MMMIYVVYYCNSVCADFWSFIWVVIFFYFLSVYCPFYGVRTSSTIYIIIIIIIIISRSEHYVVLFHIRHQIPVHLSFHAVPGPIIVSGGLSWGSGGGGTEWMWVAFSDVHWVVGGHGGRVDAVTLTCAALIVTPYWPAWRFTPSSSSGGAIAKL